MHNVTQIAIRNPKRIFRCLADPLAVHYFFKNFAILIVLELELSRQIYFIANLQSIFK